MALAVTAAAEEPGQPEEAETGEWGGFAIEDFPDFSSGVPSTEEAAAEPEETVPEPERSESEPERPEPPEPEPELPEQEEEEPPEAAPPETAEAEAEIPVGTPQNDPEEQPGAFPLWVILIPVIIIAVCAGIFLVRRKNSE
jgi:hypothetical protein